MLWVSCFLTGVLLFVLNILYSSVFWVVEWDFLNMGVLSLSATFIFDFFSLLFFMVVMLISSVIFFFAQYYMDGDKTMKGFIVLLFLFVSSMFLLVLSPNLVFLLLGWDGLGVVSYLLVVYYSNYSSSVAGMLTFLVNRLGDVFFFLSICFLFLVLDWNFFELSYSYSLVSFFLIVGFITKSAQIPFSSWLPAAMAAPTPVSSLVHSSTLVTAGIYLMIRFHALLVFSFYWLMLLALTTILMAGIMANMDWDLKKIIAFSTLSQLGFMVFSISCGLVVFTFFHLVTHALFKASLFMCSGVIIHSSDNIQDFRNSGQYFSSAPLLSSAMVVCLLCLCGFPFSSGFFSKDMILDGVGLSFFFFFFFILGVCLTFSYSFRFSYYVFFSKDVAHSKVKKMYENVVYLLVPVWLLVVCSLFLGFFWFESVYYFSVMLFVSKGWKLFYWVLFFSFLFVTFWFFFSFSFYLKHWFFSQMWYLQNIFSGIFLKISLLFSFLLVKMIDQGWSESFGGGGLLSFGSKYSTKNLNHLLFYFFNFFFLFFVFILL